MGGSADIELGQAEAVETGAGGRRLLLVASQDDRFISPCLLHAVRREFPWLDVLFVDSMEKACEVQARSVPLLLIDLALSARYLTMIEALQQAHPQAAVAFLSKGARSPGPAEILSLPGVRGVLPMQLALDVWLAALRVLILGGEYFSSDFVQAAVQARPVVADANRPDEKSEEPPAFWSLTARETQILELVSRGQQNKLIASALRLSENTVKIHIHHIIAKLGVHNRTEAASFYLEAPKSARRRAADAPAGGSPSP